MTALGLLIAVAVVMWLSQAALLRLAGVRSSMSARSARLPRHLRRVNRLITNVAFVAALLVYPLSRGHPPLAYYASFFPLGERPVEMLYGAAAAILYLCLLYLAWTVSDNVRFEIRHERRRLVRRMAAALPTAVFAALVEELLFRAVLLADLLEGFSESVAVVLGVVVFAAAHYIRGAKRYWTFPGHLALGALFCLAFVFSGALWLPLGLHAGGVLVLMAVRPYIRYTGPAWLVGASIFPYAGVMGVMALVLLIVNLWVRYGVTT